jgi:hypothetical protein
MANTPLSRDKDRIYIGDTYPIALRCKKKDPANQYNEIAATPVQAKVILYDQGQDTYLDLGGPGVQEVSANIDADVVSYTIPGAFHAAESDLTAFVTITFDDNQVVTEPRKYKVREKRS